jgi:hypothetical protein
MVSKIENDFFANNNKKNPLLEEHPSFFKQYLINKFNLKNDLQQSFSGKINNSSLLKKGIVIKYKPNSPDFLQKENVAKLCVFYLGNLNNVDSIEETNRKTSKTKEFYKKIQKKLQLKKHRFMNSEFNRVYSEIKQRQKLKKKQMEEKIDILNYEMNLMKNWQYNAKFFTFGLYAVTMMYSLMKKKISIFKTLFFTAGFLGLHSATQISITKYYISKVKRHI